MECTLLVKLIFKLKFHDHECNLWTRFQTEQNWAWCIPRWSQTHYIIARKDLGFFSLCNLLSIIKDKIFQESSITHLKSMNIPGLYPVQTNTSPTMVLTHSKALARMRYWNSVLPLVTTSGKHFILVLPLVCAPLNLLARKNLCPDL